jgi:iron complex transport system substrate-binding protein
MVYRKNAFALIAILMLASSFACAKRELATAANTAPTRQVTDDLGRTVVVPGKITRVVSLAPNLTENIFAVGAGDRLVGVTTFCNYPEPAKQIAKIGDTMNPNIETIVALKPDVVFVSTASQIETFMQTLDRNGIAVYVTNPDSLDGVVKNLRQLGELFGTSSEADKTANGLTQRIAALDAKLAGVKRVPVFVQISNEPLFTIGKQSFLTAALDKAGAVSVTADVETAYPKLSKETAVVLNPEAIILSDSEDNREPNSIFARERLIGNGRVYRVNADLLSRPGPRLVDALEEIARDLHPDIFK